MQNIIRRSFVKSPLASAVVVAVSSLHRSALAAEEFLEVKFAKDPRNLQASLS